MRDRQIEGAGLTLLALLAATVVTGIAWRHLPLFAADGEDAWRSGRLREASFQNQGPMRELFVPAGWRAEQVAEALDSALIADGDRFRDLVLDRELTVELLGADWPGASSLEGYLFPGTYEVAADAPEERLLADMVKEFRRRFSPAMLQRASDLGLSPHEVVTLASIVERESSLPSESPVIAGVFLNRLQAGVPLQADPTVAYTIDSVEEVAEGTSIYWQRQLTASDLEFDSPYNTYLIEGLPSGPIASPSLQTIMAVLYPADADYLFFVAKNNGAHAFARTLPEHEENVRLYRSTQERDASLEAHASSPASDLQRLVEDTVAPVEGHIGVVVRQLVTGDAAYVDADDHFSMAGLYRLYVMDAAFSHRESGQVSFDERIAIYEAADTQSRPSIDTLLRDSTTVAEAVEEMIVSGSDAAAARLLGKVGGQEATSIARGQGLADTWLSEAGQITTPLDVAHFLELAAAGRAVNESADSEMLSMLGRAEGDPLLAEALPAGVRTPHLASAQDFLRHEAGLLYTSGGPIVIVVMSEALSRPQAAEEAITRLGKLVFEYFESYRPAADRSTAADDSACRTNPSRPTGVGELAGKTIALDPGHGGSDSGATFTFADGTVLKEKDVALDVADRLKDLLIHEGATVYMTRCRDIFLSDAARAAFANSVSIDLFVSIHLNGSAEAARDGTQVSYASRGGGILANYLLGLYAQPALWDALNDHLSLLNDGVRREDFGVLAFSAVPSALTESVYLTNPQEADALRDAGTSETSRRQEIALGHLVGIVNYFRHFGEGD